MLKKTTARHALAEFAGGEPIVSELPVNLACLQMPAPSRIGRRLTRPRTH
jgi:hypothetical protein